MVNIIIYCFAVLGGIVTLLTFLQLSTTAHIWWTDFVNFLNSKIKLKALQKSASKNQIESIINATVFDLQKELPYNWVKRMKIQWVDQGSIRRLNNGESIIRIQPSTLQDENIINGVYHYYHHTIFPNTYEVIPPRVLNSVALRLSHRTINNNNRSRFLLNRFEKTIMEREVQNDNGLLNFLSPFEELDNRGFFTGALIREMDDVASGIRFKAERNDFENEIVRTMNHMLEFAKKLPNAPDHLWYYENHSHVFKFLLARRTNRNKVDVYLKRVKEAFDNNVKRLYVFGSNNDLEFTAKLIRRIHQDGFYSHKETFDLDRDFRTNEKGIGALFLKRTT